MCRRLAYRNIQTAGTSKAPKTHTNPLCVGPEQTLWYLKAAETPKPALEWQTQRASKSCLFATTPCIGECVCVLCTFNSYPSFTFSTFPAPTQRL